MKERLRRIILFAVIVITGSVMILLDVPLLFLIPLIFATGFVALLILGAITVSDIKSFFKGRFVNLREIPILKQPEEKQAFSKKKEERGFDVAKKTSPVSQVRFFFSSISSLGTVIRESNKHKKKVEHINELLDKTVGEKVKGSALAGAAKNLGAGTAAATGGEVPGQQEHIKDKDPFMSLSGDEFDISFLEGLEDAEPMPLSHPGQGGTPSETGGHALAIPESDITLPSLEINLADHILLEKESGLEEFDGLEGVESIDLDFKDLDNLDFNDPDNNAVTEGGAPEPAVPSAGDSSYQENGAIRVKADGGSPGGFPEKGEQVSSRSDISLSGRGASHRDEDLLSTLASDVRYVKKERDLSLLRELKDFKAPATEIDDELKETYERLILPEPKKLTIAPRQSDE